MATNAELSSELNKFKEDVDNKFNRILDVMEAKITPENKPIESRAFSVTTPEQENKLIRKNEASAEASNYALNPAYQRIFEEYFDSQDGFTARLHGVYFTIIVPKEFSNADEAWKKFYKEDTRMKALKPDRIEEEMRDWCKMVARNLKYDKKVKLKV